MAQNPNQPRAGDVVLGGQTPTPFGGVVLGGLAGVKRRLASSVVAERVAAVRDTLNYGREGKDLLIPCLKDGSWQVRQTAYLLLQDCEDSTLKQALQEYNPYQLLQCLYRHSTRQYTAYSVAISPDGQILASGGSDKIITVRSLQSGKVLRTLSGHSGSVYAIAISPDGQTLVSGSSDRTIEVWNLQTALTQSRVLGDCLLSTLTGHLAEVNCLAIASNGYLVSGSEDSTIKVWNLNAGKVIYTLSGHLAGVKSVAISSDGQTLASGSADETIKVWNLQTGELLYTLQGHSNWIKCVAISHNSILASGSQDKTIKLWNLRSGKLLNTLTEHWDEVNSVVFSPDGYTLASGSRDETIRLWHLGTKTLIHTLEGHQAGVASIAIASDGQKIVSSSWDRTIRVWGARN